MTQPLQWQFGGFLREIPSIWAWSILILFMVVAVVLTVWLYRNTMRELRTEARIFLAALRGAMLLVLLLCLANPTRMERESRKDSSSDTLAVVVDRSESMSAADHRGTTRLADAARIWQKHESETGQAFLRTENFRFAVALQPARAFDEAVKAGDPGPETHLYAALQQALKTSPGAIVCLTDGLDTTGGNADELASEALRASVPLYFVVGSNRMQPSEAFNIREVKSPSRVLRQTEFTVSAVLQVATARDGEVPVELWSGETKLAAAKVPVHGGLNTVTWSSPVTADEAGTLPLEFRAGEGDKQQLIGCTTQVVENLSTEVLYYQGALQWGYRFFLTAIQSDPSFRVTSILNPAMGAQISSSSSDQPIFSDLPDDARALKKFQIIILAHVVFDQLSEKQQKALVEYSRAGGGVLFISPDSQVLERYVGTPLEQMLPIAFAPVSVSRDADDAMRDFQEQISNVGRGNDALSDEDAKRQSVKTLQPFILPPGTSRTKTQVVFHDTNAADMPKFFDHAKIRSVKAGAEILALAGPPGTSGAQQVILARQQFGEGFSAALMTDLLWRWKLSLPSTSRAAEKFWQQLLFSLSPPSAAAFRLVKLTDLPAVNGPVFFRVQGSSSDLPPLIEAISPDGQRTPLVLEPAPQEEGVVWKTKFTPPSIGRWKVSASDGAANNAYVTFRVGERVRTTETLNLPPDIDGLKQLAERTGGALIKEESVFSARTAEMENSTPQKAKPKWNSPWLFCLLLGLYGTELVARRYLRLL